MFRKHLGLLGGGQLGEMLKPAADRLNIDLAILDSADCALAGKVSHHVVGNTDDPEKTLELAKACELVTIEIEKVHVEALRKVEAMGIPVFPPPNVIEIIQDKGKQKDFFRQHAIPTAPYFHADETTSCPPESEFPIIQKLRRGGYDGKGVKILKNASEWNERFLEPSIFEEKIAIEKEISVIVARSRDGETKTFPTVEMVFNPRLNLLDHLRCPADWSAELDQKATALALQTAERLQTVGLLAVEMFYTQAGDLLVNELAPRPHNSGHHTIEACATSQFEQHLRAIQGLPLGNTSLKAKCALMMNLLGEPGHIGPARVEGADISIPGVYVHLYSKAETRPGRKMGHVTILSETPDEGFAKLEKVRKCLRIVSNPRKNP